MRPRPGLYGVGGRLAPAASRPAPPGRGVSARLDALDAPYDVGGRPLAPPFPPS
jgi:hypothetical protein